MAVDFQEAIRIREQRKKQRRSALVGAGTIATKLGAAGGATTAAIASPGVYAGVGSIGAGGAAGGATGTAGTAGLSTVGTGANVLPVVGAFYGISSLIGKGFRALHSKTHPGLLMAQGATARAKQMAATDILSGKYSVEDAAKLRTPTYTYRMVGEDRFLIEPTGEMGPAGEALGFARQQMADEIGRSLETQTGRFKTGKELYPQAPFDVGRYRRVPGIGTVWAGKDPGVIPATVKAARRL